MVHFLEVWTWCTFLRGGAPEEKNQIRKGTKQTNQAFFFGTVTLGTAVPLALKIVVQFEKALVQIFFCKNPQKII